MKHCDCRSLGCPADFAMSPDTLRTLADDHRLCEMPAKFRWAMQWAAEEIERLRLTENERIAIESLIAEEYRRGAYFWADTLKKFLERVR